MVRDGGAWVLVNPSVFKTAVRRDERLGGVRFSCTSATITLKINTLQIVALQIVALQTVTAASVLIAVA